MMNSLFFVILFVMIGAVYVIIMNQKSKKAAGQLDINQYLDKKDQISQEMIANQLSFIKKMNER